jgi:hypothetical protein
MPSVSAMKPMPTDLPASCWVLLRRCSQGFIGMKMVAALLLLPPPIRSKPLTMKMLSSAGWSLTSAQALGGGPVRASVAPSGSCAAARNQPWSSGGTKLPGTFHSSQPTPQQHGREQQPALRRGGAAPRCTAPRRSARDPAEAAVEGARPGFRRARA